MTPALKSASGLLTALALCVLGAAPAPAAPHSATATPVPHIWPTPQQLRPGHGTQPVPEDVVEVIGHATDPAARALTERVLRDAGARTIRTVRAGRPTPPAALTVYLGGPTENPATPDPSQARRFGRGPCRARCSTKVCRATTCSLA